MNCLWHWLEERRVWRNHRTPRFYCVEIKALVRNFTSTACERYQLDVSDGIGRCVLLNLVLGKMSHSVDWPHSIVVKTLTFWLWDYSQTGSIWRLLVLWKGHMWVTSECNNKPLMLFVYSFPSAKHTDSGLVSCLRSHIRTSAKSHNSGSPLSASPPAEYRKGRKVNAQPTAPEKKKNPNDAAPVNPCENNCQFWLCADLWFLAAGRGH